MAGASTGSLSPDTVKRACKGQAHKIGLSVGDFGDVRRDDGRGRWTTRMNVRDTGEKFKARCEWDGRGEPRLTVEETGMGIASRLFTESDVKSRCRSHAMSTGLQTGDFGDTAFEGDSDQWVTTLWLRQSGVKYKARCEWDGFRDPRFVRLDSSSFESAARLSRKHVQRACKQQARSQGLQVGDFGDVDYDRRSGLYTTRMNVRSTGRKYKATCRWDGNSQPVVE
jgi:hypothetical protein